MLYEGPLEENVATVGAGLKFGIVFVAKIVAEGFLQKERKSHKTSIYH